ncbi:MAG: hypothetical protein ABIR96_06730 [Bdellovibrionota bacterium]
MFNWRLGVVIFSAIASLDAIATTPLKTHEAAPLQKTSDDRLKDDDCMGRLPANYDTILKKIREVRDLVAQGSLSAKQAQDLVAQEAKKNSVDAQGLGAVYATDALHQMQDSTTKYYSIVGQLASGAQLSPEDDHTLLSYVRLVDPTIDESRLPEIKNKLIASTNGLKARGAIFSRGGLDLSKMDLNKIDTDMGLRKDLTAFFPELEVQLQARKDSHAPQNIIIGTQIILPHGRVVSSEQWGKEVQEWLEIFDDNLVSYSKSSRTASTYADWMRGRFRPEKDDDGHWKVRTDEATAAELERDASYKQLNKTLEILRTKYALDPELQKKLIGAMTDVLKEEGKVIDKNITATRHVKWAVELNGAFSVFAVLTKVPRTMALAWGAATLVSAANVGVSAWASHRNLGGNFFCQLSDKMTDNAGSFALAPVAAIAAPILAPTTIASLANAIRIPFTSAGVATVYGTGVKLAGLAGVGDGSIKALSAIGSHRKAVLAEARGETSAAAEFRLQRDQALIDAGFELPAGFMAFKAGRAIVTASKIAEAISPAERLQQLINKKITDIPDGKTLLKEVDDLLVARASLESSPASVADFRKWIQANPLEATDFYQIKKMLKGQNTLDDLLAQLAAKYAESVGAAKGLAWKQEFSWLYTPRTILTDVSAAAKAGGKKIGGMIVQGTVLGAIMSVSNAGLEQNIAPAQDLARSVAAVFFGDLAATERETVLQVNTQLKELHKAQEELDKAKQAGPMTSEAWSKFQNRFSEVYGSFVNSLPPQARDGRAIFMDFESWGPINTGHILAESEFQYLHHKDIIDTLQEKKASGQPLNDRENEKLQTSLIQANVILEQMAGTIAMYQVRKFVYHNDLAKNTSPQEVAAAKGVEKIMGNISKAMGIDDYSPLVLDRLQRIVNDYQSELIGDLQKKIARPTTAPKK